MESCPQYVRFPFSPVFLTYVHSPPFQVERLRIVKLGTSWIFVGMVESNGRTGRREELLMNRDSKD